MSDTSPFWVAHIRENECIGCTKCIDVCPTDAIVGSENYSHTIIEAACVGCRKCLPPCPMDCIEMISVPEQIYNVEEVQQWSRRRKTRLLRDEQEELARHQHNKLLGAGHHSVQSTIAAAVARAKAKRSAPS